MQCWLFAGAWPMFLPVRTWCNNVVIHIRAVAAAAMSVQVKSKELSGLNTLGLRSVAPASVDYVDDEQLPELTELARQFDQVFVLGGGSNVVLPAQVPGLLVHVATRGIALVDATPSHWLVEAQAGENWHGFVSACLAQGWAGLENLALIPGTVGASPVQNIGAYGLELETRIERVSAWDLQEGRLQVFSREACNFAYRDSFFKHQPQGRWLITKVCFALPRQWEPRIEYPDLAACRALWDQGVLQPKQVFDTVCQVRSSKLPDPAVLGNAGSFFKNPVVAAAQYEHIKSVYPDLVAYEQPDGSYKLAAGWLLDRAGWKGFRDGPVGVHERQALVLVNFGGATAADIEALAKRLRADVFKRYGVLLEQEPVRAGVGQAA